MNYKEICQKHLKIQRNILNALCETRDKFDDNSTESNFFQGIIMTMSTGSNAFSLDFSQAEILELKDNIINNK